jgi:hypothetical protein
LRTDAQLDQITAGAKPAGYFDSFFVGPGFGTVSAGFTSTGALSNFPEGRPPAFQPTSPVPQQAAASPKNPSFVADGLYTAGPGNPSTNVGKNAP